MRFKKIYIEITNYCNLNCEFCKTNVRKNKYISLEEFNIVINKIKPYTKYVYLHVLGEPLLHKDIDKLILICKHNDIKVNITSNGTLLNIAGEKLLNDEIDNIHQINLSLHCDFKEKYLEAEYFQNLIKFISEASKKTYINLRLWNVEEKNNEKNKKIIELLLKEFKNKEEQNINFLNTITISKNIFLHFDKKFTWPNILGEEIFTEGKCYALRDQVGILVDGTVVPCCLDGEGIINLGNIYEDDFLEIITSDRATKMKKNFENRKVIEKYCKTCGFWSR